MKFVKKIPMAITGVSLALAALGNLLLPRGEWIRYTLGILSAVILIVFILKLALDFERVKEELKNPIVLSVLPTSTMTLMLLCAYIKPHIGSAAQYLWYAALTVHVLIMLLFVKRFMLNFKIQSVFPSWFIVCAGIAAASVTSPAMGARNVGQVIFYVAFALYIAALPFVIYRLVKIKPFPEPARPTIAIFTAPVSLCLAGYLSAFEQPNAIMVYVMLAIAAVSYVYVSINMVFLLRLKFYPTYAAFTFPYVISAVAFKSSNAFLVKNGYDFFTSIPAISEWIAIAVVAYVLVRYIMFLVTPSRAS